ncbi:MAG: 5-formyltetrahydrofolate cyclo-ligase [Jatrophihabitans sp.]|uniref:5-formyltetrahydrofolate cyclo-ligase n=1 Tax=Jatrophihabitans sp. TaxID=1932789 RepID=UPI003F820924
MANEGTSQHAKTHLRRRLLDARRSLPPDELLRARAAIADLLLHRAGADRWRTVAAYEPLRTEPGSLELLAGLRAAGVTVLVPHLLPDNDLDWTPWGEHRALGNSAIADCDVVLVPALAVSTRSGVRLGRGGGSYDRALGRRGPGAPAIALLYESELLPDVPAEPWDRPVDEVVTPVGFARVPLLDGNGPVGDHG